jgi:predicted nucleotidyltransferase
MDQSKDRRDRAPRTAPPTWSTIDGAPPRRHLLAAAVPFVQAAMRLPGVTRVALLGSLTTDKADPKDIDLLVTISDKTDVSALDRLARQLQGRISATAHGLYGADVFLADSAGRYLGRLCKHRACPSLRQCAARHCGRRPHLKDDLDVITLEQTLIAAPPVVLWPTIIGQGVGPSDVETSLLAALRS